MSSSTTPEAIVAAQYSSVRRHLSRLTVVVNGSAASSHTRSSSSSVETTRPWAVSRCSSTATSFGLSASRAPARVAVRCAGSSRRSPCTSTGGVAERELRLTARIRATSSAYANGLGR